MTDDWKLGRRPALDGIRGLAIVLVVAAHLRVPGVPGGGVAGVTLFFVLSGFLITSILAEERRDLGRVDLRAFYGRRALRLLPALFLLLAYTVLAALLAPRLGIDLHGGGEVQELVVATVFYVANWFRVLGHSLGGLHHTWSLAIEEQFYLVWPAVLLVAVRLFGLRSRRLALVAVVLAGASLADRFLLHPGSSQATLDRLYFGTDTRADALLLGCALALWLVAGGGLRVPAVALGAGALLLAYASHLSGARDLVTLGPTAGAAGGLLMIAAVLEHERTAALLSWEPLRWIGRISYGLYLWHVPVSDELQPRLAHVSLLVQIVVCSAASLAVAVVSYYVVERPFLRMKRRWVRVPDSLRANREPEVAGAVVG